MGKKVDQQQLARFEKGKTTYAEVIQQLGPPTQATVHYDGSRVVIYTYAQSQVKAASFIPLAGVFLGGADTENTSVILHFDTNALLTDYAATEGRTAIGTGMTSGQRP
jgi:outer membrane protein assembly factor BamE (lipoprotein component of BamABCDE complex)